MLNPLLLQAGTLCVCVCWYIHTCVRAYVCVCTKTPKFAQLTFQGGIESISKSPRLIVQGCKNKVKELL